MCMFGLMPLGGRQSAGGAPGRQNVNHLALVDILSTRGTHPTTVRFWHWRVDRRGLPDGYSGTSLATGLGLARAFEAAALSLPALVAALAVLAGLAGLEGFDLAGWEVVDDERLGGMAPKSFLLCEHREQSSS